jgi:hypothetical protein
MGKPSVRGHHLDKHHQDRTFGDGERCHTSSPAEISIAVTGPARSAWFKDPEGNIIGLVKVES